MKTLIAITCFSMALLTVHGQEVPANYQGVLKTLDKKGDYKSSVLKINIPRNDLKSRLTEPQRRRPLVSVAGSR